MKSPTSAQANLARRSISGHTKTGGPDNQHVYDSIVDLIANPDNPTPMVRLSERYNPAPDFDLFIKLEGFNPFGSIKDRTALLHAAKQTGANANGRAVVISPDGAAKYVSAYAEYLQDD